VNLEIIFLEFMNDLVDMINKKKSFNILKYKIIILFL